MQNKIRGYKLDFLPLSKHFSNDRRKETNWLNKYRKKEEMYLSHLCAFKTY